MLSLLLIPSFFSSVSYNIIGGGLGGPSNTMSNKAANIIQNEFPNSNNSQNAIIIVLQNSSVYSEALEQKILSLNATLCKDSNVGNCTGVESLYSVEADLLNESLPDILNQTANLQANIITINSGLYSLQDNLTTLSTNLFQLQDGINQTAQMVYGIPTGFVYIWQQAMSNTSDPIAASAYANNMFNTSSNLGNDEAIAYYSTFYNYWNASFQSLPSNTTAFDREAYAIGNAVTDFLNNTQLDEQASQMLGLVASGLTVSNWNQPQALENLTISTMTSSIPSDLSSALGVSATDLLSSLYGFGQSPSNATLGNYAISLLENSYSNLASGDQGFSLSDLMQSTYNLGSTTDNSQTWNLACDLIANATESTFTQSPLFNVNSASLSSLLSELSPNSTSGDINQAIDNEIATQPYANYPYAMSTSLTGNFVNSQNNTMLIVFNFSSNPDSNTIANVESDVQNSGLQNFGTVYVTGGPVVTQDAGNVFLPALELTIGPGIIISLVIVGLLFMAPLAALIPVLLGGVSIAVALAVIYEGFVKIGGGNITFLTPTLTILLMLGLAVDYSVLQLRRTREERLKGKPIQESVGISIKWAGQAVLTAGITVIAAYIVMAVVNVPIFSDVGIAIVFGVSILLAASLTLLPALEIALGDRIFWPRLNKQSMVKLDQKAGPKKSILRRLGQSTLKRKIPVIIIISIISICAFIVVYNTPTDEEFLRLIPNFSSNQGLAAISNDFGSGALSPTQIVVTTATPITYGDNQFNQTLLNQIEQITAAAATSNGVSSVSSTTRPFGSAFNYTSLGNMPDQIRQQYESQMLTTIGQDNKTAIITVNLSNSADSLAAINSLKGVEKNIGNLSLNGINVYYGGETQSTYDSITFMTGLIPEVIAILAAAIYVILFFQLRSAFTPIRLIITILCSVVCSLAFTYGIFYYGLNLPILDFAPLFVVVTMLGVGIDYDIFFLTRIREEVLSGKTDNEAIITAIDKIWTTILGLGLVVAIVFISLLLTNVAILEEIALAVAAAILIDVTVVILFFVPSLMGLAQKMNWWPYKLSRNKKPENNENNC